MNRKRFQSHWKDLLASHVPAATGNETTATPAASEAVADASTASQLWRAARQLLHRYRYPCLAATCSVLTLCMLVVYGRGDSRPHRVGVAGRVLIDGQPLTRGRILFVPEHGRPSAAAIDGQGRFQLTCFENHDGAVQGTHRLAVAPSGTDLEADTPWPVPARYSDFRTSGLSAEITSSTDSLVVQLTTDGESAQRKTQPVPPKDRPPAN